MPTWRGKGRFRRFGPWTCRLRRSRRIKKRGRALVVAALAAWVLGPGALRAETVMDLLAAHQIRALDPPEAAVELELPDLRGGRAALSQSRGRWVILTFFATWCGPCRSEMPSLQRLHEARGADGLTVMAISVDQRREDAARYVENLGLTFPVLWDEGGRAARIYSASTIPVSFVIDPSGVVVGVSQGARDWSGLTTLVDGLFMAPSSELEGYAVAQGRVGLPEDVVPPTATVRMLDTVPRVGRPFSVEILVRWSGSFQDYILHPPQIHLPEGVEQLRLSAQAGSQEGRRTVSYEAVLQAHGPGSYALDPVEIRYTPRLAQEAMSTRLEGPTIEVTGGRSKILLASGLTGAAALAAVVGLGMINRKRRASRPVAPDHGREELKGRYDEARRKRLQGDVPGFLGDMEEICRGLGVAGLDPDILEGVRYGGQLPSGLLLDQLQRDVERELAERQREPEHDARAGLKLAGERTENEKENRA